MRDWAGGSEATLKELKTASAGLKAAADRIEKKRRIADNVAKALGKLDKIIKTGRDLLA
jgi:hypothetical protein